MTFEKALGLKRKVWRIWGRGKRCIWRWSVCVCMWERERGLDKRGC